MLKYQNYHRHSYYSNTRISDSAASNEDYAKRAAELGHGIISTCEHGTTGRYIEGYELAEQYGLRFVFSTEAYWVHNREEKDRTNCHIMLIARNESGRQAINDIMSEACLTGFYGQPRVDVDLILSLPPNDVIVTTACVAYWRYDDVDEITKRFAEHFGDNFYLEVQYHDTESQKLLNERILNLSQQLGVKIIMGCDSHYISENGSIERDDFLVSKGMHYDDEEGWYLDYPDGDTAYKRFAKQGVLTHSQIMEAMGNTNVMLTVETYDNPCFNRDVKMPTLYPNETQAERDARYEKLVWDAWDAEKEFIDDSQWSHYEREIQKEIDIVKTTLHSDYFLLDHAIVKRAKELGGVITRSGRGSSVSFITNKLIGLTEVDRVSAKVHMYPERFMSPTRILETKSLADIDINVASQAEFAQAQIDILGDGHSYPMITYGTMKPKAAWKMYAKSQNVDFELANVVSQQITRFEDALKHASEDERDMIVADDFIESQYMDIYNQSRAYQGVVVSASIHPCSYLLYQGNIRKEIGLTRAKDNIVCCMDGKWAEGYKFLKNDILRVAVVDLIARIFDKVGIEQPPISELLSMCENDPKVWDIYKRGCTLGINQVEQDGTRQRVMKYAPTNISELCAFVAAIRPGFKSLYRTFEARKPFVYGIKALDELIQTEEMPNSFILYQEMSMAVLNYAGIPMSECYEIIKNIAKKRVNKVLAYKEQFLSQFADKLIQKERSSSDEAGRISEAVWTILEDSSSYIFNACLAPETRLQRAGDSSSRFRPTVEEMFKIRHDADYAKKTKHKELREKYVRYGYGNALSMYDNGRIYGNSIVDIRQSGVRPIYNVVTESGANILCTDNHKFPTPDGVKQLRELSVGDILFVKGQYEKCTKTHVFTKDGNPTNIPKLGEKGFQKNPDGSSVIFNSARELHVANKDCCSGCSVNYSEDGHFELHHVDGDSTNNSEDNYAWLCNSCHKKAHYKMGRVKVFGKGIPTFQDKIVSIEYVRDDMTYDVEMADPAHTIVSESGLVASNSHSYCVAIDSLYGAYLKAYYPLQFYEVFLSIMQSKGDKDRMQAAKEEAEDYFGIRFPPFRFGQDNRAVVTNEETNEIMNSLVAIKGFGQSVADLLYECGQENPSSFIQVLSWLDAHSMKSAKVIPLIKIDYFQRYGNIPELLEIVEMWDFFKQGTAKQISKEKENPYVDEEVMSQYATDINAKGQVLKTYTISDCGALIDACVKRIYDKHIPDWGFADKAAAQLQVLDAIDLTTNQKQDRRKLMITGLVPLRDKTTGEPWAYRVITRSIGSGKTAALSVRANMFKQRPLVKGDIIYGSSIKQNDKGYWYLYDYDVIDRLPAGKGA